MIYRFIHFKIFIFLIGPATIFIYNFTKKRFGLVYQPSYLEKKKKQTAKMKINRKLPSSKDFIQLQHFV